MRSRSSQIVVVVLVAGLVALAAGCGGGGKSSSSTETLSSSGTVTNPSAGSGGSGSTPSFASAKNCQDLAGLAAKAASVLTASSGNPATALKSEAGILQGLADAAPSDIHDDFQTLAAAFTGFVTALEKAGYKPGSNAPPTATQISALTKAAKVLETVKVRRAERHLNAWVKQNCKGVHVGY